MAIQYFYDYFIFLGSLVNLDNMSHMTRRYIDLTVDWFLQKEPVSLPLHSRSLEFYHESETTHFYSYFMICDQLETFDPECSD